MGDSSFKIKGDVSVILVKTEASDYQKKGIAKLISGDTNDRVTISGKTEDGRDFVANAKTNGLKEIKHDSKIEISDITVGDKKYTFLDNGNKSAKPLEVYVDEKDPKKLSAESNILLEQLVRTGFVSNKGILPEQFRRVRANEVLTELKPVKVGSLSEMIGSIKIASLSGDDLTPNQVAGDKIPNVSGTVVRVERGLMS